MFKRFFFFILLNLLSISSYALNYQYVNQTTVTCLNLVYPNLTPASMTQLWSNTAVDDNVSGSINIGFNFPFNSTNYSTVTIGINGVIFLGWNGGTTYSSTTIPTNTFNGPVLFPFWNDLYKNATASKVSYGVTGTSPNRAFVVQYTNIQNYSNQSSASNNTFQIQMWENGDIVYKYTSMLDPGATFTGTTTAGASVGLQTTRLSGSQYSYHTNSVPSGTVILFRPTTSTMPTNSVCSSPASSFNAVETSLTSGYSTGKIYTKLASAAFSLNIVALNASGNILTTYPGLSPATVTVSLLDWSGASPTCSTAPVIAGSSNALTYTTVDAGYKTTSWTINNSYPIVKVKIVDSTNNVTSCSSDTFSIRPASFNISSTKSLPIVSISSSYAPVLVAGSNFDINYTAVNTAGTSTTNYNNTPTTISANATAHAGATTVGSINGTLNTAVSGTATSNLNYSEVGFVNFELNTISDSTYTTTDGSSDCISGSYSNVIDVSGKYGCLIANSNTLWIGRFIPDHFDISGITFIPRNDYPSCSGTFNYIGEDLKWNYTFNAKNTSNNVTQNYTGSYNKANLSTTTNYMLKAKSTSVLSTYITSATGAITNGTGSASLIGGLNRSVLSNIQNANWGMKFTDSDGVSTSINTDLDAVVGNDSLLLSTGISHRFGMLSLGSAVGNNNTPIKVPYQVLYRDSNGWHISSDDTCTTYGTNNVVVGNLNNISNGAISILGVSSLSSGSGFITIKTTGTTQANFDIGFQNNSSLAVCPTFTQSNTSTGSNKNYLSGNYCSSTFDKDARTRVSIGINSKNTPIIYWQEKY